ncbi:MAG: porin [Myxococcota bacterium]
MLSPGFAARALCVLLFVLATPALAADRHQELLDALLENGSITQEQHDELSEEEERKAEEESAKRDSADLPPVGAGPDDEVDERVNEEIARAVERVLEREFPIKGSYGSKGFRLETRDGNWQTNLQWRFQFRLTHPYTGDPRQVANFNSSQERTSFDARRLRMKIGGHGYRPWLKYYFEIDLQPLRDADDSSARSSARVIDWRVDIAKFEKIALRLGQWKIDYNRERVDSSGRQQFVERSIVNRIFTIDRQVGVSLRGRLFAGTPADLRYYAGIFNGEGRGTSNDDNELMYVGRIQWNFLGRDLALRQTDVERTEKPTGSLAFGAAQTRSRCTRWSSSGCGNLDGFAAPGAANLRQFETRQAVQELAFKWQGFSFQQEWHWKRVEDKAMNTENDLYGFYAQSGYFFHELFEVVPEELELAFRYAFVREPNATSRNRSNERQEFTLGANWFFWGHNNKITADWSYLTLDDDVLRRDVFDHRFRLQWDISF